jgi:hypothetical protein
VRFHDRWLYLYLLLEFQSSIDPFMAVRIMTYLGLLYQDLIAQREAGDPMILPPVLPIVLYNGSTRWNAHTQVFDLIETAPAPLPDYAPRLQYLLLDEGAIDESGPLALKNIAAAIFRLEKSRDPNAIRTVVRALAHWLRAPEQLGLRRAILRWLKLVFLPARLPGIELPEVQDLQEVDAMLAERVMEWTQEWKREGLEEGLQQGREQGLEQGMEQGMEQGKNLGRIEGMSEFLGRQLSKKFGPLTAAARARLQAANAAQLDTWGERVLEARTLDEVFRDH